MTRRNVAYAADLVAGGAAWGRAALSDTPTGPMEIIAEAIAAARLEGVRAGLEAAAKECDTLGVNSWDEPTGVVNEQWVAGTNDCAKAIRAIDPADVLK